MEKKLAVLSVSGGLDSTCLLLKLLSEGYRVQAYSFDYGQKHIIEQEKLKRNISFLQERNLPVKLQIIDLKDCFSDSQSSLCKEGENIPKGDYNEENMSSTVVENRNVIFASIIYGKALSLSKKEGNIPVDIFLGIHAGDHFLYRDCAPESREACEKAFKVSNNGSELISYQAPFVNINKSQVLKAGLEAMADMEFSRESIMTVLKNTHSCYDPNEQGRACGKCGTCKERLQCFADNGLEDPVEYQ